MLLPPQSRTRLRRHCSPLRPGQEAYRKNLTDDAWDHGSTDGAIFDNIKNGVPPDFNMTPWKDQMKDDEIWNVVNYLRSIAKKK
jgi:mono/diheme cytochrome c family protein